MHTCLDVLLILSFTGQGRLAFTVLVTFGFISTSYSFGKGYVLGMKLVLWESRDHVTA